MKVLIKNRQRLIKINLQKLKCNSRKALRLLGLKKAELSILLVNDRGMKALNSMHRHIGKTTDVLSFPQMSYSVKRKALSVKSYNAINAQRTTLLGDIVINLQAAKRQATEHGLSFMEEIRWLLVHGILHLIGYDHEKSKYAERKMRTKERELLEYISKL
ncbi:MAG: rRNA maturation RNase YbeY [Thermodesulfovibrionales bacterium]|nr:rRNA maturation RNase YbeY [Thermodesulfovibrionales bacterium]